MAAAAKDLIKEAEGKLKGGGLFSFFTGGPNYQEAQDLYQQAANQYKLAKDWNEAATCLSQCAFCAKEGGSTTDQANFLMESGNVLKKISSAQAVEKYEQAMGIFSAAGRFQQCGKLLLQIAEMYESERLSHKETKDYYKRAAEMFELDDHSKTSFSKCNIKVAEFAAKDGEVDEAIKIFETEGEKSLQNNLLQFNAKEHFFRAGILHLVQGDSVTINLALEKYRSLDPRFETSREGELLANLATAFGEADVDAFVDKLGEYDAVAKLTPWATEFLVKVKDSMAGPVGGDFDLT